MKLSSLRRSLDRGKKEERGVSTVEKLEKLWKPQEGPQTQAYYHQADELLYGGIFLFINR
jgi:hypothetical protein